MKLSREQVVDAAVGAYENLVGAPGCHARPAPDQIRRHLGPNESTIVNAIIVELNEGMEAHFDDDPLDRSVRLMETLARDFERIAEALRGLKATTL